MSLPRLRFGLLWGTQAALSNCLPGSIGRVGRKGHIGKRESRRSGSFGRPFRRSHVFPTDWQQPDRVGPIDQGPR